MSATTPRGNSRYLTSHKNLFYWHYLIWSFIIKTKLTLCTLPLAYYTKYLSITPFLMTFTILTRYRIFYFSSTYLRMAFHAETIKRKLSVCILPQVHIMISLPVVVVPLSISYYPANFLWERSLDTQVYTFGKGFALDGPFWWLIPDKCGCVTHDTVQLSRTIHD